MQVIVRSILFQILFYLNLLVHFCVAMATLVMPRWGILNLVKFWAGTNLWLLRTICNIRVEFRGLEKIPPGPLLVASKHQSTWETFALVPLFSDPAFVLKRELTWVPFFGWFAWKAEMIPVNRGARAQALVALTARAHAELARGRQIVIFPEGTRRAPGAEPAYKYGVVHLYGESGVACVPVALNSGLFWPRRSLRLNPGTIVLEVLDPIAAGLDKPAFAETLKSVIEIATTRLIAEAKQRGAAG